MKQYSEEDLRLLTQVLPNVAMQLRNAMTNVFTAMQQLAPPDERDANKTLDRTAAAFSRSYYRICRILNNLSDAESLAETALFPLYNDDIVGLCRDVCKKAEGLFDLNGVTLDFTADRESRIIGMDAERMERLMLHLLSNALKFTPRGGRVSVSVRGSGSSILLTVADTGCGIAADRLDAVFDCFLDSERLSPAPYGLGLGLALCRRIAQGHGGRIMAESEEGKGAAFTVALPNRKADNIRLRDVRFDYTGGFNPYLVQLSDALGAEAFEQKYLD